MPNPSTTLRPAQRCTALSLLHAAAILLALLPAGVGPAHAEEIEEIVVTADYRATALDELPVSVTVIGAAEVQERGAVHLEQVLAAAPNLGFASGSSRARHLQIRGIGERSQFAEPLNASVGLIVDGVDYSGLGTTATLFDVEQVEVLRGPQGTRYGANALAGLIAVRTHAPTATPEWRLTGEAADYATWRLGVAGGGATGLAGLDYRIAIEQHRSDGTIDNRTRGDDTAALDERTIRARLRWQFAEHGDANLMIGRVDVDNGYDNFSLDNDRRPSSDDPGHDRQASRFLALAIDHPLGQGANVELRVAADRSDIDYGYDEDWTFAGFHPDGYRSTDRYLRDRAVESAELRVLSTDAGALLRGRTRWLVGFYGINEDVELERRYTFLAAPFRSRFDTERRAVYAQLDTDLGAGWRLGIGGRHEQRDADYQDNEAVAFDPSERLAGGELSLSWLGSTGILAYGTLARGFKAGGFNTDGTLARELREYDEERSTSVELGLKGALLADSLHYRAALFHMRRDDIQIASSITLPRDDGSAEFVDFIGNAARGKNVGVEVELDYAPVDGLLLFASVGLLRTEYQDFVDAGGIRRDGRDQAHAPRYQFATGARWQFADRWQWRIDVDGKDGFYFDDSHDARADDHVLVHSRLSYRQGGIDISLWVRNLFDADVETRGFVFGNDPRIGYENRQYTQLGEPRRVGVSVALDL